MLARLVRYCREHRLVPEASRGLVAFSGGPDSLALLDLLQRARGRLGHQLVALHLDHGLRTTSAAEARRAERLAQALGVSCVAERVDGLAAGASNLQAQARQRRLDALRRFARARGCAWIAVGHTADDQAETVVMRLLRGSGPTGVAAMRPRREELIRPLLWARRQQIERYLVGRRLEPVRDPSNDSDRYLRNRVRHSIIPALARENPAVVAALCRLASSCGEEVAALDSLSEELLQQATTERGEIELARLDAAPGGLRRRALRAAAERASCGPVTRRHVDALDRLIRSRAGTRGVDLPGVRIERRYGRLLALPPERGGPAVGHHAAEGPQVIALEDGRTLELVAARADGSPRADQLPWERVVFPLFIRAPRAGDRIDLGAGRTKKVSRVLVDRKVPLGERGGVVVVEGGGAVLLVLGHRRAAGYEARPGDRVLRFYLRK